VCVDLIDLERADTPLFIIDVCTALNALPVFKYIPDSQIYVSLDHTYAPPSKVPIVRSLSLTLGDSHICASFV
jgi:hypothetical protein